LQLHVFDVKRDTSPQLKYPAYFKWRTPGLNFDMKHNHKTYLGE
jgi:hypothetical protein